MFNMKLMPATCGTVATKESCEMLKKHGYLMRAFSYVGTVALVNAIIQHVTVGEWCHDHSLI